MFRMIRLTSLGFALIGLNLAVSVLAGEPPPPNLAGKLQQAYCMSGYMDYNDPNAYFSTLFEVRVPQNAKPSYPQDLAKVFETYLNQKYGYVRTGPLSVICTLQNIVPGGQGVQASKDILIKEKQYYHRTIVETGWKPSPQQVAAAASAPAAAGASATPKPNATTTYYAFCKGNQGDAKYYYSAVFSSVVAQSPGQSAADETRPAAESLAKSFSAFLAERHGFKGSAECYLNPTQNGAEWTWQRLRGLALNSPDRFIQTGWAPAT